MKAREIADTIKNCFDPPPEIRAARILHSKGVTEEILHSHRNSKILQCVDVAWMCNVRNALRDIERNQGEQ